MTGLVLDGNKASELLFFGWCVVDIKCKKQIFMTTLLTLTEKKTNNCTLIKFALPYITIHLHVLLASASIIRVSYMNTNNIQTFDKVRN